MKKVLFVLVVLGALAAMAETPDEWKPVERAAARGRLQVQPAGADLKVTADGVAVKPGLALGSWVGFKKMGAQATAMGDLVLTESEAGTVMTKLQQGGIEQTAVHNHLLHETPRVMYMHIRGEGDPVKLAEALRRWR